MSETSCGCEFAAQDLHLLTCHLAPAHLRDDAPERRCSHCGRRTWATSEFGRACGMPQPSGLRCVGRFPLMATMSKHAEPLTLEAVILAELLAHDSGTAYRDGLYHCKCGWISPRLVGPAAWVAPDPSRHRAGVIAQAVTAWYAEGTAG